MDLLERTAELVAVASPSLAETALADVVEAELRAHRHLHVHRIGDNVVARTEFGLDRRLVLAGHLDTVPPNGNETPRIEGDILWGLGAADMKGGLAVFLELARTVTTPTVDVTYVFYVAEEIAEEHNGLRALFGDHADLVRGDAAVLGEPTDAWIEAGCQGTARVLVEMAGARAHTARPWMGDNAIHRLGAVLAALSGAEPRRPVIDGCEYREAVQAVHVAGGVAGNVVPDTASVTVNLRFAPDRTVDDAMASLHEILDPVLDDRDRCTLVDHSPAAPPSLTDPLLAPLVAGARGVRAKLGWTDVARFAAAGIPAVNFGPGDSAVAHTRDEHVHRSSIDAVHTQLRALLTDNRP